MATCPAMASHGHLAPSSAARSYTAFYDGFYGPFHNGYWATADDYYYSPGPGRPYIRDDAHHFRQIKLSGFHPVEGSGPESDPATGAPRAHSEKPAF